MSKQKINGKVLIITPLVALNLVELTFYLMCKMSDKIVSESEKSYTIDDIKNGIINNEKLSEEEKNFLLCYFKIIDDNKQYIDINKLYNNLSLLDINYEKGNSDSYDLNGNVMGAYFYNTNEIKLFDCNNLSECKNEILVHEVCHCISNNNSSKGSSIVEAITEMMSTEYCEDYISCYPSEQLAAYSLFELLGKEDILNFYFNGDISIIINSLTNIIDNEEMAMELIDLVDNITAISDKYYNANDYDTKQSISLELYENNKKYVSLLNNYFFKKYNYSIYQDDLMKTYLIESGFRDVCKPKYDEFIPKGYINNDYIEQHSNVKLTYKKSYKTQKCISVSEAIDKGIIVFHEVDGCIQYTSNYDCYIVNDQLYYQYNEIFESEIIIDNREEKVLVLK